jgi:hypothetical protein
MGVLRWHLPAPEDLCPCIGGMEDHIHMLLQFPPMLMVADALGRLKRTRHAGCPARSAGSPGNRGMAASG